VRDCASKKMVGNICSQHKSVLTHIDSYVSRRLAPKRSFSIPIVEITIHASKDIGQPKANPTVPVDEINGKLKSGVCDVSANIDFIRWGPSPLWYNGTLSCGPCGCGDAVVQRQHQVLGWDPWRWGREIRCILHDVPYALRV
jgi:hypothetical protein